MATRHEEFLARGGRIAGISADTVAMNAAMVDKLALPFPILSDPDRDKAITPLGFADEKDAREIARTGALIVSPEGEVVMSLLGRDYADRPEEDELLDQLDSLDLPPTTQAPPAIGEIEAGERAMALEALTPYFRGAKFASLAIRGRHRGLGDEFAADTKRYVEMVDRYLDALPMVKQRRE